jgi:ABC-2 type transport system permease protein
MNPTLTAELRKLRATRTTTATALVVAGLSGVIAVANVVLAGKQQNPPLDADTFQHIVRAPTAIVGFAMLVVGVLASAGEYRHNTIVPSMLAQPRRARLAVAKMQSVTIVGLVVAAVSAAVSSATGWGLL